MHPPGIGDPVTCTALLRAAGLRHQADHGNFKGICDVEEALIEHSPPAVFYIDEHITSDA